MNSLKYSKIDFFSFTTYLRLCKQTIPLAQKALSQKSLEKSAPDPAMRTKASFHICLLPGCITGAKGYFINVSQPTAFIGFGNKNNLSIQEQKVEIRFTN